MNEIYDERQSSTKYISGTKQFYSSLAINLVFTIIWTILSAEMPHVKKNESKESLADMFYQPLEQKLYRVLLEIVGLAMAVYFSIMVRPTT